MMKTNVVPVSALGTKQAAGKAFKKAADALPSSSKKWEVIMKLAQSHRAIVQQKGKQRLLFFSDGATEKLVTDFYERCKISRQLPGTKKSCHLG